MKFSTAAIALFQGTHTAHMGAYQYAKHAGMRNGRSTSGNLLWAEAEAERKAASGNLVSSGTRLLNQAAQEITQYVPLGTPIIELGAGTVTAFKNKTVPFIQNLKTKVCTLVDESRAFLEEIIKAKDVGGAELKPIADDFFENDDPYCDEDTEAVVCSFGSTISNIVSPISSELPQEALVNSLMKLSNASNKGWMLIEFDGDKNAKGILDYFKKHGLFQLNVFDRMKAELKIEGDFDPEAFSYDPEWIASSGQLAHVAVAERDMNFAIEGTHISLKAGQKFHLKNSYKFASEFFEKCCDLAGLEVVKSWSDDSPSKVYLLKMRDKKLALRPDTRIQQHNIEVFAQPIPTTVAAHLVA